LTAGLITLLGEAAAKGEVFVSQSMLENIVHDA
jgi:hypothetical protein